ncbi:MAG: DUF11 domain-containing protein, partial [Chloroflexi bacterium]|nr:DUF11 domain-containing protein [Chloroflexota bacterium]
NGRTQTVNGYLLYARQGSLIGVRAGGLPTNWQVGFGQQAEKVHEDTSAHGGSIGMKIGRVGGEYSHRHEDRHGYILSWSKDTSFSGQVSSTGLTTTTQQYNYAPYIWLQREWSRDGTEQAFLVLDYWVEPSPVTTTFGALPPGQLVTPALPLIASPSHPDAASWYEANMAIFTWVQPADDPAAVYGYAWSLDQTPDTIPQPLNQGLTTTCTYSDLPDGLWYLHVRPVSGNEQWGETAHRAVRIDADAPQVSLTLDPPLPTGNNGWYITPLTVSVNADDSGSGVATVQVSTDGATWQLYSAPLLFTSDTAPITLWARASDAAGHISPPVTCTFKIDSTPPTSHISGGQGPGAWVATVITNALGNSQLVLAGAIQDNLSGRAGLDLGFDNIDWTSASHIGSWYPIPDQPEIEVNWYYTATTQLGRGNHVFYGRAQDRAGNLEEAYELARVVWLPTDSPDLGGSSMAASPTTVRPGEVVTFDLVVRNGGYQEALVAVTDQLPEGLTLITEALGQHVGYDSTTGLVTWPERLLWPGQYVRYSFQARAAADLPATTLVNRATAHAFWPNTDSLPTEQRQVFLDHEQTVVVSAAVQVHPGLATGADVTPPWASLAVLTSPYKRVAEGPEVPLSIVAAADAQWMYLREWTTDRTTGAWTVA